MKGLRIIVGAAITSLLVGCSTTRLVVAPVGPNPNGSPARIGGGQMEVFSAMEAQSEGDNPTWYQHTDYYICDMHGNRVRHVYNTVGHYATAPRVISLPAGEYLVKAQAKDYAWVEVPAVVKPGQITKVHLDAAWKLPAGIPKSELVSVPEGYPVGWRADRADTTKELGIN
jgi:hypothetical protein